MIQKRRLLGTVLLPTLLVTIGMTLGNAFIPLYARELGASMAGAALVASLMYIGQAAADLPGGWLVHRFGEKRIMILGGILTILAMALRFSARDLNAFTVSVLLFGVGT
jgi:MFS family permease